MKQEDGMALVVRKWNAETEQSDNVIVKIERIDKNEVGFFFSDGEDYWMDLDELVLAIKRVKDYAKY